MNKKQLARHQTHSQFHLEMPADQMNDNNWLKWNNGNQENQFCLDLNDISVK